jgi:two-component sensor histidine kinase
VREELAPFSGGQAQLGFEGPDLRLRPAAAQSLALVLHELATNAAKYGALSVNRGSICVEWRRHSDEAGAFLEIRWVEKGGPNPGKPEMSGFGSKIIHASIDRQLRGRVTKEWHEDGLRCTIRIPAAEVVPNADG